MKTRRPIIITLLLIAALILPGLPLAQAQGRDYSWELAYPQGTESGSGPDYLPQYLDLPMAALADGAKLSLDLKVLADGKAQASGVLEAAGKAINMSGQGSYRPFGPTPLMEGKFEVETEAGLAAQMVLQVYPRTDECRATLLFGGGSPPTGNPYLRQPIWQYRCHHSSISGPAKRANKFAHLL